VRYFKGVFFHGNYQIIEDGNFYSITSNLHGNNCTVKGVRSPGKTHETCCVYLIFSSTTNPVENLLKN
jgi:hypothetical protein